MSADKPHRRWNPLTGDWVLVSPHRTLRPWQGAAEPVTERGKPFDETCYLCPGNRRANGEYNPPYEEPFVFPNDFPALLPEGGSGSSKGLYRAEPARGECRVVCYSPQHNVSLAQMKPAAVRSVVGTWMQLSAELSQKWEWVQIFENKGEIMGCSSPHPHGQVWAGDWLPTLPSRESDEQAEYLRMNGRAMLLDYAESELELRERVVTANEHWVWLVPYWATWPFEILLLPLATLSRLHEMTHDQASGLAEILKLGLMAYDNLFQCSFPYSMGWHSAPGFDSPRPDWQLHAHFYPPLLRSATVKKFLVGYEMLAEAQRDLTPEAAAARLREVF